MHVTYFDEVKANAANGQNHYFVGGLSLPVEHVPKVEARVNEVAQEVFGTTELRPDTEFHGAHIYFKKGAFRDKEPEERLNVLVRLAKIIGEDDEIKRVYSAIDVTKLTSAPHKAPEFAFAHFCERVELLKRTTLLIGDLDDQQANSMIGAFAQYRSNGTPWDYGIKIQRLVDAVHFARSHHSRMIQLADIYLFALTHSWGSRKGYMAEKLTEQLKGIALWGHRYKEWPK